MNSIAPSVNPEEPDLIDRIARALPDKLRSDYYRELRHCRSLPENDEILRVLRAMQFLTLLIIQAPADVTAEREKLEHLFRSAMSKVQENLISCVAYQKLLDARLICLPDQIKKGINPNIIAAGINESLRQQFVRSTIPETAQSLAAIAEQIKKTTAEFSKTAGALTNSYQGAAELARQSIEKMESSISRASNAAKIAAQDLSITFRREYQWSLYALSCLALIVGIAFGILLHYWLDRII
jgi:hypothetical protein